MPTPHHPAAAPGRAAFTLFEVVISITLVTVAVLSTLMLLPTALQAEQQHRFRILAAAKALEMVDAYNSLHNGVSFSDHEGPNLWDVHEAYRAQQPDLEVRLASPRFGLFPLPLEIARRLDSDNGEMQAILDQGGYLYYSQPLATTALREDAQSVSPPSEAQQLVIGIVGLPQNNALYAFTPKTWPYYTGYPSPPVHVMHSGAQWLPASAYTFTWNNNTNPVSTVSGYQWEALSLAEPLVLTIFKAYENYQKASPPTAALAQTYCDAAVAYCAAKGLPAAAYNGTVVLSDFSAGFTGAQAFIQVNALRYLAHAAACLLHWGSGTSGGVAINATTVGVIHDNCVTLGMRFQATRPYDWGCPRPVQRALMVDHPLIECDLGSPQLTGAIFGSGGVTAAQWRPVAVQPITHIGLSMDHPDLTGYAPAPPPIDPAQLGTMWSPDPNHSTLAAPFSPAERCRQIVFWSVNWQLYDDCETAPSAPVDASKYLIGAPAPGRTFAARMGAVGWADRHQYPYRNPEKVLTFLSSMAGVATGAATPENGLPGTYGNDGVTGIKDEGNGATAMDIFSGRYGADRNANGRLDRGPLPPSVRLRAVTVARFNYYDLRVPAIIR